MLASTAVAFAVEKLSDSLWDELQPLLEAHWHEVAHYEDIPLEPHKDLYRFMDEKGTIRIYTARTQAPSPDRGRLIGYLAVFVAPCLHYASKIMATQDVLFVDVTHRGSRTGVDLIRFSHERLREEGVSIISQHVKHRSDINIGPMLGRLLGYEHVDDIWAFRLDKEG
jgi:GNAT superfamily N-acetyltransferase